MNVSLVGQMGSGKSTVGRQLAQALGFDFIDTDVVVEQRSGKSIRQIFSQQGEKAFRRAEARVVKVAVRRKNAVISCGGGAAASEKNLRSLLENSIVFYLKTSPEFSAAQIANPEERPLLDGGNAAKTLQKLLAKRARFYEQAHFTVDAEQNPAKTSREILAILSQPVRVCAVISAKRISGAERQIEEAKKQGAEAVEFRLDLMGGAEVEKLVERCKKSKLKCVVTCRPGGKTRKLEARKILFSKAIEAGADFVDVELDEAALLKHCRKVAGKSGTKIISSFHDFSGRAREKKLAKILRKQMRLGEAGKIAVMGGGPELLRLLGVAKEKKFTLIATPMGKKTLGGRIACGLAGSFITFAFAGRPTAAGQPSLRELKSELRPLGGRAA